jgi:hypothetical protein
MKNKVIQMRQRLMKNNYIKIVLLFLVILGNDVFPQRSVNELIKLRNFSFIRDTVYTLKPNYVEVNLTTQKGILHSKDGSVFEFGLSSGNKRLKDGIETKPGIYVIQSMMPKWFSKQFDNTLMLNWMGFNYGIGFHALQSKGYYRFLGKKKSSHGCVRLSKETAKTLYDKIDLGTAVLVHNNDNAVVVSFIDSTAKYKYYTSDKLLEKLKRRIDNMYKGNYCIGDNEKLVVDFTNVNHPGLPIGNKKQIAKLQIVGSVYSYISSVTPPALDVVLIEKPIDLSKLAVKLNN